MIFMETEDRPELATVLNLLGHVATMQGGLDAARSLYRESLLIAREIGNRRRQALIVWKGTASARGGVEVREHDPDADFDVERIWLSEALHGRSRAGHTVLD
jgi:hypothetical protein